MKPGITKRSAAGQSENFSFLAFDISLGDKNVRSAMWSAASLTLLQCGLSATAAAAANIDNKDAGTLFFLAAFRVSGEILNINET